MKSTMLITTVLTALVTPAHAQQSAIDHLAHQLAQAQNTTALTEGEVRKIDMDAKKITIRHGPIVNLDMPAMTMVFRVKEPAMLDQAKPGDKIKFTADQIGGQYRVTHIEPAK